MIAEHDILANLLRQIGLGLIAFIIGMNVYLIYKIQISTKVVIHDKVASFKKMTMALKWLLINQTILFLFLTLSRVQRLLEDAPLVWMDWAALPLFLSFILFDTYMIRNYIFAALNGSLFDKKEVKKMHLEEDFPS